MRPLQKGIFLPPALFANTHLLLNKLRFAAELKNKHAVFLHAVSSYAKLFICVHLWLNDALGPGWGAVINLE